MNSVGKSSVVFVTLSGLFWGGWVVGSQTPEGEAALAQAYEAYATQQAVANEDLFSPTALRVVVCGAERAGMDATAPKPCLAVVAAGKMFIVDAGSGAAQSLAQRNIPLDRLDAVLLTGAGFDQSADLDALYAGAARNGDTLLPVYGPADTQRLVDGLNQAAGFDGASTGLQAWGPGPEPGRSVVVYEGEGLVVSAFTTQQDAFAGRIGYRFDYRGRSIVVGGDGRVVSSDTAMNADVVLADAQSETLAHLHAEGAMTAREAAAQARAANAGMLVLTGAENRMSASMQLSEARTESVSDVISGRVGMVLELPLSSQAVNVRAL